MKYDIFISYKRISIETANNLYYRLTQKGYSVFFDLEEMRTDKFPQQIEEYIKGAKDIFILIEPMSLKACKDGTYKDDWFCREMKIALDNKKHIIPMLLKGYEMPKAETLPLELRSITEYNSPKFDIVFFDAYIEKLISKGFINSQPILKEEKLSVFKFLSNEDCKVYKGSELIGAVRGMSDDPFYVFVERKGQYMYKCVNDYTLESKTIKVSIDANEEQFIEIEWEKRFGEIIVNPIVEGDKYHVTVGNYGFDMIRVQGGKMLVGATSEQADNAEINEAPAHEIELPTFYMGEFLVTQTLWTLVMGYNKSRFKEYGIMKNALTYAAIGSSFGWIGTGIGAVAGAFKNKVKKSLNIENEYPIENISLEEAQEFVRRLSDMTKITFSLPTEAEWEYAARGGQKSKHFMYAGSDNLDEVGWFKDNADGTTHPVGKKKANELGLYDMSGNVWEWTETRAYSYLDVSPDDNNSDIYIRRGGSWWHEAKNCRVSRRYPSKMTKKTSGLGLRLVIRIKSSDMVNCKM